MPGEARVTIKDKTWTVWLANTAAEWAQGLSNVPSIPVGTGMLFDLGVDQVITVNTTSMLFDLDIICIHSTAGVVDVAKNMKPGYDEIIPNALARYFLEVNAGEAQDVQVGDSVNIDVGWATADEVADLSGLVALMTQIAIFGMTLGLLGKVMKLAPREVPAKLSAQHASIPWEAKQPLVDRYGTWAVNLAEARCPENDVECVEREARILYETTRHRRMAGAT